MIRSLMSHNIWMVEEIRYLEKLSSTCQELANRYKALYNMYRSKQIKYKLPTIILGSVLGLASFGSSQFGQDNQNKISIFVGAANILISVVSSVEAFLKLGENMSGSLVASNSYQKLKEKIDIELALPPEGRSSQGLIFLRECYAEYQKIGDLAPAVLTKNRYILEETKKLKLFSPTWQHTPRSESFEEYKRARLARTTVDGTDHVGIEITMTPPSNKPRIIDIPK